MRGDDVFHQDVAPLVQRQQARRRFGNAHHGEVRLAARGLELQGQIEGQVGDVWKGMGGVDGQRREHRLQAGGEHLLHCRARFLPQVGHVLDLDALALQRGEELVAEAAIHVIEQAPRALANGVQLAAGRFRRLVAEGDDQVAHLAHADHQELVEIVRADAEELHALQQRDRLALRLAQHAPVERNPTELAVDERETRIRRGRDQRGSGRRHGLWCRNDIAEFGHGKEGDATPNRAVLPCKFCV